MIPDLVFLHREHAEAYIDAQPGVMGRRAKWSERPQVGGVPLCDWLIKLVDVIDYDIIGCELNRREELRRAALTKLSSEEKKALGLSDI